LIIGLYALLLLLLVLPLFSATDLLLGAMRARRILSFFSATDLLLGAVLARRVLIFSATDLLLAVLAWRVLIFSRFCRRTWRRRALGRTVSAICARARGIADQLLERGRGSPRRSGTDPRLHVHPNISVGLVVAEPLVQARVGPRPPRRRAHPRERTP